MYIEVKKMENEKMNKEEIKKIIEENGLAQELRDLSFCRDESEQSNIGLYLSIWNDGKVTLDLIPGNCYSTGEGLKERISLPRIVIYDNYDIGAALESGIKNEDIEENAIEVYKENFDFDEYFENFEVL